MDPEYKIVSRFDTDNSVDEDKNGQAKKSKVDPPRSSNISVASSEDFFHLDPKLLPMFNAPKVPRENAQSPLRDDQSGFGRNSSFKSEDHDRWSQGATSPISDIMQESTLQNMSPTRSPPVQVMKRHRDHLKYDPKRIPSSVFASKSSPPAEWSAASNDSLFSIRLGNDSREHIRKVPGDLHKHEDLHKAGDPLKFRKPFPAMERKSDDKRSEVKNKLGSDEPHAGVPKETIDPSEVRFSPIEISFSSPQANRRSDVSELEAQKFAGSIKKSTGCSMCNCANCRWTMCACTWPRCCCFTCEWPSCCSCKWSSCCSCKWSSCCSCKWSSCCLCKWPSCCSCKWPSCCSCKWPSCCSCKWPRCSCKLSSCCACKWPSCCSCGWPSCPRCSFKCFRCSSCSCGWPSCPSCSSCSCKCFSWPSCNCSSCSWPFICSWKCKPKRIFCCCSSEISTDDGICDPDQKKAPKRRSRCCHFPRFSWSWFSCRCC